MFFFVLISDRFIWGCHQGDGVWHAQLLHQPRHWRITFCLRSLLKRCRTVAEGLTIPWQSVGFCCLNRFGMWWVVVKIYVFANFVSQNQIHVRICLRTTRQMAANHQWFMDHRLRTALCSLLLNLSQVGVHIGIATSPFVCIHRCQLSASHGNCLRWTQGSSSASFPSHFSCRGRFFKVFFVTWLAVWSLCFIIILMNT